MYFLLLLFQADDWLGLVRVGGVGQVKGAAIFKAWFSLEYRLQDLPAIWQWSKHCEVEILLLLCTDSTNIFGLYYLNNRLFNLIAYFQEKKLEFREKSTSEPINLVI